MFRKTSFLAIAFTLACAASAFALDPPRLGDPSSEEQGVKIEGLKLSWVTVPGAASYRVQMSTNPQFTLLLPLEKANDVKESTTEFKTASYAVALTPPAKLLPDTKYYWRVIAQCPPTGRACTERVSVAQRFRTEISVKGATSRGFSLTLGREGDKAKKPASFKYAYTKEKGEVFTANYSLLWRARVQPICKGAFFTHSLFHDGSLSSDEKATDTAIRVGYQGAFDYSLGDTSSLFVTVALLNEANQSYDTGKNLGEVSLTGSSKALAIGYARPLNNEKPFQFMWEPTVTLTYGRTVKIGDSTEQRDTIQRYALRIATTTELNVIERLLNTRRVALVVVGTQWKLPNEDIDEHDLFEATLQFDFTDNISVGLDYKRGEQPPEFKGLKNYGLSASAGATPRVVALGREAVVCPVGGWRGSDCGRQRRRVDRDRDGNPENQVPSRRCKHRSDRVQPDEPFRRDPGFQVA